MDPDANLACQRAIAARILKRADAGYPPSRIDAYRLADLVEALDEWLKGGGFLPGDWCGPDK